MNCCNTVSIPAAAFAKLIAAAGAPRVWRDPLAGNRRRSVRFELPERLGMLPTPATGSATGGGAAGGTAR